MNNFQCSGIWEAFKICISDTQLDHYSLSQAARHCSPCMLFLDCDFDLNTEPETHISFWRSFGVCLCTQTDADIALRRVWNAKRSFQSLRLQGQSDKWWQLCNFLWIHINKDLLIVRSLWKQKWFRCGRPAEFCCVSDVMACSALTLFFASNNTSLFTILISKYIVWWSVFALIDCKCQL